MEAIIEKPYILLTDYKLIEADDILALLNKMVVANKFELVIICDNIESHALATAIVNSPHVMNSTTGRPGRIFTVAIQIPSSPDKKQTMEDLALLIGAKLFTESKGDKLENIEITDLGRAEQFICRKDESIIIEPKGKKLDIRNAIINIQIAIAKETNESKKKELQNRLGVFTNKLARIKVGAPTENEYKALKYKVEDAVNSVKVAFKSGVVCGAGFALARIKTSSPILNEALKYPTRQLMENAGINESSNLPANLDEDHVMNVVTGKVGPFISVGVVDPVEVLIAGVESAISIASVLLTSSGMIVDEVKDQS
jgi:chaperonin GroEL